MEQQFGANFSAVQVHPDSPHAMSLGVGAYATGNELHFAPGEYDPHSTTGLELIGHELTHVIQQRQGRVSPQRPQATSPTRPAQGAAPALPGPQLRPPPLAAPSQPPEPTGRTASRNVVHDDPALEHEADALGRRVARGEHVATGDGTAAGTAVQAGKKGDGSNKREREDDDKKPIPDDRRALPDTWPVGQQAVEPLAQPHLAPSQPPSAPPAKKPRTRKQHNPQPSQLPVPLPAPQASGQGAKEDEEAVLRSLLPAEHEKQQEQAEHKQVVPIDTSIHPEKEEEEEEEEEEEGTRQSGAPAPSRDHGQAGPPSRWAGMTPGAISDSIRTAEDAPTIYSSDPRFAQLSKDPDHGGNVTKASVKEAMAILQAERQGLVQGPAERGPRTIDFYDKDGHPLDVKAPPSPPPGARWLFNVEQAGKSIVKQLAVQFKSRDTDQQENVKVVLDTSYLESRHLEQLERYIKEHAPQDIQEQIIRVRVQFVDKET